MVICLYCARQSVASAGRCEHCGRVLSAVSHAAPQMSDRGRADAIRRRRAFRAGLLVIVLVCAVQVFRLAEKKLQQDAIGLVRAVEAQPAGHSPEALRTRLLAYIAQHNNSGQDFEEQLLGRARLELLQQDDEEVYFSLPEGDNSPQAIRQQLSRFLADPTRIELATAENNRLTVGRIALDKRADRAVLFKTPEANVRFAPDLTLSFRFERGTYTISLREAVDYITNQNAFGGRLQVRSGERSGGRELVFANHGTFVARRGEPSLQRFVAELTHNIPADLPDVREKRIQRLVDFVSQEILYDDNEAASRTEILKHPVETLISRHGDCSNKAILLGSLLEQLAEDYLFLYCPQHITVAVKQGRFADRTRLDFHWDNERWLIAEATAQGFQIGQSQIEQDWILRQVQFVQRPGQQNLIIDTRTGRPAEFR